MSTRKNEGTVRVEHIHLGKSESQESMGREENSYVKRESIFYMHIFGQQGSFEL
jgi:hypothetical protein